MYANYHTHTPRCKHARGTGKEYVENAIAAGIKILGFSDHVPYPQGGYQSGIRMSLEETAGYVEEAHALQKEYKSDIQILLGYEAEYYPHYFEEMLQHILQFECDYLILGQHHTENEFDGVYAGYPTDQTAVLKRYVEQVLEGLDSGVFSYLAHPDLIHFTGDEDIYIEEMRKICKKAKELQLPLELNLLGMRENRHYPSKRFFRLVAEEKNPVILGVDAHDPAALLDKQTEEEALKFLEGLGIPVVETVQLRRVTLLK